MKFQLQVGPNQYDARTTLPQDGYKAINVFCKGDISEDEKNAIKTRIDEAVKSVASIVLHESSWWSAGPPGVYLSFEILGNKDAMATVLNNLGLTAERIKEIITDEAQMRAAKNMR